MLISIIKEEFVLSNIQNNVTDGSGFLLFWYDGVNANTLQGTPQLLEIRRALCHLRESPRITPPTCPT